MSHPGASHLISAVLTSNLCAKLVQCSQCVVWLGPDLLVCSSWVKKDVHLTGPPWGIGASSASMASRAAWINGIPSSSPRS
mmetsp:Transcript_2187/g.5006  ORF Transcript_2187/g.5006 Transcript_2187/m.5006 type:complete len:81 (-) Transcript_2187:923-1165(-)